MIDLCSLQIAHATQLDDVQLGNRADGVSFVAQLFEQQRFGDIVLLIQALLAFGFDGLESAVAGLPNAQRRDRNAGRFGHRANAVVQA